MKDPGSILKQFWGYEKFRPLQEDIIRSVLDGNDVLALLPTGGGKSICFQVPGLILEGISIVISPLIALMKDQVENLSKRGIKAEAIYSGMSFREIDRILDNSVYGDIKFLYVSPERLKTEIFLERVNKMKVALLIVDEAHCISQWGYDFRPSYLEISEFRKIIPNKNTIALTATATERVRKDIVEKLEMENPEIFLKSFSRANLSYSVREVEDKYGKLLEILNNVNGTGIIYVYTRKRTMEIASWLLKQNISADFYHGGLSGEERSRKQELWIKNRIRIMVCTNAFGMGIDKPDVRIVVHMDLPDNLESYYQEAGRAGRDEKKSYAVIVFNNKDIEELKARVKRSYPSMEFIKRVYQSLANYYGLAVGSHNMESLDFDIKEFSKSYKFDPVEVYHAMKILADEGLLDLTESFYAPSKVYVKVQSTALYEFQVANPAYDELIKSILRIYGGEVFSNFVRISEKQISAYLNVDQEKVVENLKKLDQLMIIEYEQQKDQPQITFLTPRMDTSGIKLESEDLNYRREVEIKKMKSVIQYVTHKDRCRTQLLLEYFDEVSYDSCGICDICIEKSRDFDLNNYDEYSGLITEALKKESKSPEELVRAIKTLNKKELLETIRIMLDDGIIKYNATGQLILSDEN